MKLRITQRLLLCLALLAATPLVFYTNTAAQVSMSPEHLDKIRQNCVTTQTTMQRIKRNDLATRINFGRAYDSLMTKLMKPLNTRMVANRAPIAPGLAEKTTNLEVHLEAFRDHYAEYSHELDEALRSDCQKEPEEFYNAAMRAKDLRARVAGDVKTLKEITKSYQKDVADHAKTLGGEAQ